MAQWPELPVNIIIKWLKERSSSLIVADFGCGENLNWILPMCIAMIICWTHIHYKCLTTSVISCFGSSAIVILLKFITGDARLAKNVKNKVFSIDLVSNDPSVIACDMSNVSPSFILYTSLLWSLHESLMSLMSVIT